MKAIRRNGYSLLETLVALSLLALLIATLAGGVRLSTRAWETARTGAAIDEADALVRAIAWRMERSVSAKRIGAEGAPVAAFIGGPDTCRFVAISEGRADWGGLITTEIGGDGTGNLVAWTQVYRADIFLAPRQAMRNTRLSDRLLDLRFSYYGALSSDQPPRWRDEWRAAYALPVLIRASLRLRGARGPVESAATVATPPQ